MDHHIRSSADIPSITFVDSLAETLRDYGVDESEVYALPPSLINYLSYLMGMGEDLSEEILQLQTTATQQEKDLRRLRTQRNSLLSKVEKLTGEDTEAA